MKNFSLILRLLVVTTLSFGALAGCTPKNEVASNQAGSLEIWVTEEYEAYFNAVGREFTSATNNQVKTNVTSFPSQEHLEEALVYVLAEDAGPDVALTTGTWAINNARKIRPLVGGQTLTPEKMRREYARAAVKASMIGEALLGVPLGVKTLGIYYNEDHFVTRLPDANAPADTWKDLKNDITQLTKTDTSATRFSATGGAIGLVNNISYPAEILSNIMLQMGTQFFDTEGTTATIANGVQGAYPTDKAVDYYTRFGRTNYKEYSWNDRMDQDMDAFINGETSLVFGYADTYKTLIEKIESDPRRLIIPENVRTSPLPQLSTGGDVRIMAHVPMLVVPRSTKSKDTSWRFLTYMTRSDVLHGLWEQNRLPSPKLDMLIEQQSNDVLGVFARQAKTAMHVYIPIPYEEFTAGINEIIMLVQTANMKPQSAAQQVQKSWAETLDSLQKLREITQGS